MAGGQLEVQIDQFGLGGGDQGADDQRDVAAGEIMRFEGPRGDAVLIADARLHRHDLAADDHRGAHLAEGHAQQVEDADARPRGDRLDPQAEVAGEHGQHDHQEEEPDHAAKDDQDPDGVFVERLGQQ